MWGHCGPAYLSVGVSDLRAQCEVVVPQGRLELDELSTALQLEPLCKKR